MEEPLKMKVREIPILDYCTKKIVRYLEDKDLDDSFVEELRHDNIQAVYRWLDKGKEKLAYTTKESENPTAFTPLLKYRRGDLGIIDVEDCKIADNDCPTIIEIAAFYAINAGCEYVEEDDIFIAPFSMQRWRLVSKESADRSITIRKGGKIIETFHFKRIWPR